MSPKWIGSTQPELSFDKSIYGETYEIGNIKPVLGAIAMALLLSTTGCTAMTGETAGQYVDDSTITTAVKAKLVADKAANLTRVDVDTTKQVVSLNGIVESADQKARAEQLAKQVDGVRKVDNNLQIQKKN